MSLDTPDTQSSPDKPKLTPLSADILSLLTNPSSKKRKAESLATPRKSSRLQVKLPPLQGSPMIAEAPKLSPLGFSEPELATPVPVYTGLPLEAFPTAKIKKESLWPTNNKKKSKTTSRTPSPPAEASTAIESAYKKSLKTHESDQLTAASEIRHPAKRKPSRSSKQPPKTPVQPTRKPSARHSAGLSKIKVISPKKPANTTLAVQAPPSKPAEPSADDELKDNDDYCHTCGGSGVFICCDSCPKSFHFTCCNPPIEECPDDNWNCLECLAKQEKNLPSWNHMGMFGQLLNQHEGRNPTEFRLPKRLRNNTFADVGTDNDGSYLDNTLKPEISYSKLNGTQINGYNRNDDLDVDALYDKKGRPYLCHKCGLSGLKKKYLIHCDYCPLVWHLDCLEDPLCVPKTLGSKWKCPNHVDHLLPQSLFTKRNFANTPVVDVSLHQHFLEIASMNNIVIKYQDQAFMKDGKTFPLQEYLHMQEQNFVAASSQFDDSSDDSDDDVHEDFKPPPYLQSQEVDGNVKAKALKNLSRMLALTDSTSEGPQSFIYRIPEESIVLGFLSKFSKKNIMDEINQYEQLQQQDQEKDDLVVSTLSEIHTKNTKFDGSSSVDSDKSSLDFLALVQHACSLENLSPPPVELGPDEIKDLLDIKRLMQLKGKKNLLQFLNQ